MVAPLVGQLASLLSATDLAGQAAVFAALSDIFAGGFFWIVGLVVLVIAACELSGLRYIANNKVGVVEKLWSMKGSVPEGGIIALHGEAGFQAEVLRGGMHFGLWRWQFRIHRMPLVAIPQGKIGYVYARDGEALLPSQTLGAGDCLQQLPGRTGISWGRVDRTGQPAGVRPAGTPAGNPARGRLRDQRRTVHRGDRGHGLPSGSRRGARSSRRCSSGRLT